MCVTIPFAIACIYLPRGPVFYATSIATMYFISWYHAPMAVSVDDLAADDRSATAQSLVIFLMHLFGTAPAALAVGALNDVVGLRAALMLPVAAIAVAALCMVHALPGFAADHEAARRC